MRGPLLSSRFLLCLAALALAAACSHPPEPRPAPRRGEVVVIPRLWAGLSVPTPPDTAGVERGLDFRLRESAMAPDRPAAPSGGAMSPLPASRTLALLGRLPALPIEARDSFRFPTRSPPPPRTGTTLAAAFPPPEGAAPPRPDTALPVEALQVARVTPTGDAQQVAEVVVVFSQAMVPLTTVSALDASQVPVRLTPQPAGRWSWVDTRTLRFEPTRRLPMAMRYVLEVPAGTRSATGAALAAPFRAEFSTAPPRATGAYPNVLVRQEYRAPNDSRGPAPRVPDFDSYPATGLSPLVVITFDQRVDPAAMLRSIELTADSLVRPVRLATAAEIAADSTARRLVAAADTGQWVVVRPVAPLPRDAAVTVAVLSGAPSAEGPRLAEVTQELYFHTYGPLEIRRRVCDQAANGGCAPGGRWTIDFSNEIDSASWSSDYVRVDPAVAGLRVDLPNWNSVGLQGDTRPRTTYRVTLDPRIRDVFGQTLGPAEPEEFELGDPASLLSLPGAPFIVLDPAGPPRVLVQSRGEPAFRVRLYRVTPDDWPAYAAAVLRFQQEDRGVGVLSPPGELVSTTTVRPAGGAMGSFAETQVDVSPALRGGMGHAVLVVDSATDAGAEGRRVRRSPLFAWVQSTRIGLTAMVDRRDLRAWASSLADGRPLAGVELRLAPTGARAATDAAGLASLPLARAASSFLVARLGDDSAILPDEPYAGMGQGWQLRDPGGELLWSVFSDRGLYKPGEKVSLKGWMRRSDLGSGGLALPTGIGRVRYTVTGPQQEEIGKGELTPGPLGGFATAFDLPAALNLGGVQLHLEAIGEDVPESGRETYAAVQVQQFRRPEYEVTVDAEAGPHLVGESITATGRAAYYSGGGLPASTVEWRATSSPGHFTPPGWDGWSFGRPGWWGEGGRTSVRTLRGITDARGEHHVQLDLLSVDPPFPSSVRLDAQVGDVNRQVGSAGVDLLVHPAALYAGLRAGRGWVRPGDTLGIEIAAVDLAGRAVAGRTVTLIAERVQWRWLPRSGRAEVTTSDPVSVCRVASAAEPVRCLWRPAEAGSYRLRAEIRDDAGRPSRTELQTWVAGEQAPVSPEQADAAAITLVPDRTEYQPGDTARVLVRSPLHPATGVVTIRQSGVLRTEPIRLAEATQELRIPITEDLIPNAHLRVDLVDARTGTSYAAGEVALSVPPRRRELKVEITPRDSLLLPGATSSLDVRVLGPDGRPAAGAEVAVWMVDEAVLSLGGYQLPDPLAAFYPQRYPDVRDLGTRPFVLLAPRSAGPGTLSGVAVDARTGERFVGLDLVLEGTELRTTTAQNGSFTFQGVAPGRYVLRTDRNIAFALRVEVEVPPQGVHLGTVLVPASDAQFRDDGEGNASIPPMAPPPPPAPGEARIQLREASGFQKLEAGAVANQSAAAPQVTLRTDFAALALFAPSLRTDAAGRVSVPVHLPQSLTRYRVMAVAVAGTSRFGRGESTVTARRELMVRPSAPRFLNFGDRVEIPVVLQNSTGRALTVDVAARGNGIRLEAPAGQRVTVPAHDRVELRFPATADGAGTAQLQVVAVAGAVSDASIITFPVYTPATAEAFATYGELDNASPLVLPVSVPGGVLTGFGGVEVTVSSTALQELTDAVLYLDSYPYEGAEQIASRLMAIAALRDVLAAFRAQGLPSPDSLLSAVQRDVSRLAALQGGDGGWSYWRPDLPADPYVTVHVAHALVRARVNGFAVPATTLDRALGYLSGPLATGVAAYGPRARTAVLAYSLYVRDLAGDGRAPAEARRLLAAERAARPLDEIPLEPAGWLLHVLSHDAASSADARELLRVIRNHATDTAATATFATSYGGEEHLILSSARRSDAVVLEALIAADSGSDLIAKTARGLLAHRTRGRWSGTQENAWALLALQQYFRVYERTTPSFRSRVWLDDRFAGEHLFQGRTTERYHLELPMRLVATPDSTRSLTIARAGEGRMYYRAGLRYAPADLTLDPLQRGFTVERSYEAVDDSSDVRRDPYGNWRIRAGARVRVHLSMTAPSRRYHVALMDPLPAGLEPVNRELRGTGFGEPPSPGPIPLGRGPIRPLPGPGGFGQWFVHQNLRDDRAEAFADLLPAGRYDYSYLARATTPGTFVVPPPRAEEMYAPESFGRGATARVIVE
jgi:uncharacterized protein YfaS (alpha-2-macroglobulin family)